MTKLKYALVSVYNKNKLKFLCSILKKNKIRIISTGSTSKKIKSLGYQCQKVESLTNFKEILDGRVKTLHPKIHASLLFNRKNKKHSKEFNNLKFPNISFVIVNLYPFETKLNKKNFKNLIEFIDIGGNTLLRSAAKNFEHVTAVCDIEDYKLLNKNLNENNSNTTLNFRKKMAGKIFRLTSKYDGLISNWIDKNNMKIKSNLSVYDLKYGENPHQKSMIYIKKRTNSYYTNQIQGKKIGYNNLLDIDSAFRCVSEFQKPTCVIIKHNTPCGAASNKLITLAFKYAINADLKSSFGGVVAFNKNRSQWP